MVCRMVFIDFSPVNTFFSGVKGRGECECSLLALMFDFDNDGRFN